MIGDKYKTASYKLHEVISELHEQYKIQSKNSVNREKIICPPAFTSKEMHGFSSFSSQSQGKDISLNIAVTQSHLVYIEQRILEVLKYHLGMNWQNHLKLYQDNRVILMQRGFRLLYIP